MQALFDAINAICGKIQVVSDLFWYFPTNVPAYAAIPVLGNFPLSILILVGTGIFFTLQLRFIQVRRFGYGLKVLREAKAEAIGISPLAAFFLSTAMRVGPGNILGVTGAISVGGPGALFWMWVSAFFGMATAYVESTLAQIFKEKRGGEYVGGLPFYGRRLLKNVAGVGVLLSVLYILYALLCLPAQGFNTISAVGAIAETVTGSAIATNSAFYWVCFVLMLVLTVYLASGGIKKITRVTDLLVPIMAVVYVLTVLVLVALNLTRLPGFFYAVFKGAFQPDAVFGGVFGIALCQGVRRGLMSNEAGQGTITMPAAASDARHPCDQGCVQALGVFLDTMVICTLTGFVVVMGSAWVTNAGWGKLGKLPMFLASCTELAPGTLFNSAVTLLVSLCFGLFAFTCLMGFISFSEICANRITRRRSFILGVRGLCLAVIAFGVMTNIAGLDLEALWNLSDFANILIAYCNIPLLYIGFHLVKKATVHFEKQDGTPFTSQVAGVDVPAWDEKAKQ